MVDRKSTRLNSSHRCISYAVFCLKKKREEPGAECVLVVELVAAFEHADPGLLEEVFGQFAASGQVHEIAEKAMLVLLDEAVEQVGISTSKSTRDPGALLCHRVLEKEGSRVHTLLI